MEVMAGVPSVDPDAQATITDFLDYTEYLPSDLVRSLTLIGKLDDSYLAAADTVHELTKEYGSLPNMSSSSRPSSRSLRHDISHNLDYAISCRESSRGEASRLFEVVDRHYNRLTNIISKLHALPKPPSRDPTPVPRSPQASRRSPPRITLRLGTTAPAGTTTEKPQKMHRSRKITVPGEVLPPPNPDSPSHFTDSDWESIPPSPIPMPTSRVGGSRKSGKIRLPKAPKVPMLLKAPKAPRPPRPPGAMGTNVHSAVAGISTSNALSLLSPPPADAKPGSVHAPWMRLTEWEMAKLRKRMKKNAIWTPSETMIRRELSIAGRGPENYRSAKAKSEAEGTEFVDDDNIATTVVPPGKPLAPGEISAASLGLADTSLSKANASLSNRGMELNKAKKLKRETLAREQADNLASEAQKLATLGTTFKELFAHPPAQPLESPLASASFSVPKPKESPKKQIVPGKISGEVSKPESITIPAKKRKRDETPESEAPHKQLEVATSLAKPSPKKRNAEIARIAPLSITTKTVTTTMPLAAPAPSPPRLSRRSTPATPATPVMAAPEKPKGVTSPKATATSSRPRRISLTLKGPAPPAPEPVHASPRTSSRAVSRRSSTVPPSATTPLESLPCKSATPAPPMSPAPAVTAAGRRSKRPAPGVVIESQDGGPAVSVGKRQHAPKRRGGLVSVNTRRAAENASAKEKEAATKAEDEAAGEHIGDDEPRYCFCGDVSYGDMVSCDNDQCEREWFHFGCVGLKEPPARRAKWYCSECKAKLGKK